MMMIVLFIPISCAFISPINRDLHQQCGYLTTASPRQFPASYDFLTDQTLFSRETICWSIGDTEDSSTTDTVGGTASLPEEVTNLVKSLVGTGVLALPCGLAKLGDSPKVFVPGIIIILIVGMINAFFFSLIGRVCSSTGASTYREAWDRTVGAPRYKKGSLRSVSGQLVATTVALKTFLSCLAFSIVLADSFQSLFITVGFINISRTESLATVTFLALLPLCSISNLKSLAPFSFFGLLGMVFTTVTILMRCFDGSYAEGGVFYNSLPPDLLPSFGSDGPNIQGLVLACTLATAYVAHYNSPRFHTELANNTDKRFDFITVTAYGISTAIFITVASAGFSTFGSTSLGNILNNYSQYDYLAIFSRVAISLSIVFTYPIAFVGFRDGVLDVLKVTKDDITDQNLYVLTFFLLLIISIFAVIFQDLALLLAVGGGTFSTAVSSIFPALMYHASIAQKEQVSADDELRVKVALALMIICSLIGALGVVFALQEI